MIPLRPGSRPDPLAGSLYDAIRADPAMAGQPCRTAVERRLGLHGPPETLSAIGARLGVSRQRAHQLVARGTAAFEASSGWPGAVNRRLHALAPFTLESLSAEPWTPRHDEACLRALVSLACGDGMHRLDVAGIETYSPIPAPEWREAVACVMRALGGSANGSVHPRLMEACRKALGTRSETHGALLAACARRSVSAERKPAPTIETMVDEVLRGSGGPLHPFDVLAAVEARLTKRASLPRVRARLASAHVPLPDGRYAAGG